MSERVRSAFVGLGSNLDKPARQIENAFERLASIPDTELAARSSLYRSSPLGGIEQPDFVNAVAWLDTLLEPLALLYELQAIESTQGRDRSGPRWGPRVLDLDLLVYADVETSGDELTLPHPGIGERNFVLLPLLEIAPELEIPGLGPVSGITINRHEPQISLIA